MLTDVRTRTVNTHRLADGFFPGPRFISATVSTSAAVLLLRAGQTKSPRAQASWSDTSKEGADRGRR